MPQFGGGPKCAVCDKTVYANEERRAGLRVFHVRCFKCCLCNKSLDSTTTAEHEDKVYCKACHGKNFGPRGYGFAGGAAGLSTGQNVLSDSTTNNLSSHPDSTTDNSSSHPDSTTNKATVQQNSFANGGGGGASSTGPDACGRCGKTVYFAEQVLSLGKKWHRPCFSCASCKKSVDSTNATDHEGELYCKGCYGRNFGPKGIGYGIGAGTLQM